MAPELRPYSALKVELSALNSETVLIDGWKVIWFCTMSLRLMPLIWKLTVSSRLAAGLKADGAWPGKGGGEKAVLRRRDRAGDEQAEVNEVPAVEGNLLHGAL